MKRGKRCHIAAVFDLKWPYKRHYGIFAGLKEYAQDHADWAFDVSSFPELELNRGGRFDGIIGRISAECAEAAESASIPVVNLWMDSPVTGKVPEVHPDFREAGRMAAEHLIRRGFRRLVYFGFSRHGAALQYLGLEEVAKEHGVALTRFKVSGSWDERARDWQKFDDAVNRILGANKEPVGVICITDELARAVASICQKNDWRIPDEVAVIGTGNDELICTTMAPSLSSIAMGYFRCGYEAGRLLDRMMRGKQADCLVRSYPPRELILRHSTDAYAVNDTKIEAALRHMSERCGSPLSVDEVARCVGLGRKTLERRFRKHTGRTVLGELNRMRIARLKRLLVESDATIAELSEKSGFGNLVSMHDLFKRSAKMTPGQYRERHGTRPMD